MSIFYYENFQIYRRVEISLQWTHCLESAVTLFLIFHFIFKCFLTVVKDTWHKIYCLNHIELDSSVALSTFILLCNIHVFFIYQPLSCIPHPQSPPYNLPAQKCWHESQLGVSGDPIPSCSALKRNLNCNSAPQFPYLYNGGRSRSLPVRRVCNSEKPVPPPVTGFSSWPLLSSNSTEGPEARSWWKWKC